MKQIIRWHAGLVRMSAWALGLAVVMTNLACIDDDGASADQNHGPRIELISNAAISLSALVNESTSASFAFTNSSDLRLFFEFTTDAQWLLVSPADGTAEPSATRQATLTATCPEEPGDYLAEVELRSNDRAQERQQLVVNLRCDLPQTGSVEVSVSGLSGVDGAITMAGPDNFFAALAETTTLSDLAPGDYHLVASEVGEGVTIYEVAQSELSVTVEAGQTSLAEFAYQPVGGALEISISGLTEGLVGAVAVVGAGGVVGIHEHGDVLEALMPGTYTLEAQLVEAPPAIFAAPDVEVTVRSRVRARGVTRYELLRGSLSVSVTGLPDGLVGDVAVTGPGGYEAQLEEGTTLEDLVPGDYVVDAASIIDGVARYDASRSDVQIVSSETAEAEVVYELVLGRLDLTISGLPNGLDANVVVRNDDGFSRQVVATESIDDLVPGEYIVTTKDVVDGPTVYTGEGFAVTVSSSPVQSATIGYEIVLGSLDMTIVGLPPELDAVVVVTHESGASYVLTGSETLESLLPGMYTLIPAQVPNVDVIYRAVEATTTVVSNETSALTVTYLAFDNPTEITTEDDSGPGSLRDVVAETLPGSTLHFADDVALIVLTSGEILIDKNLTFEGPGVEALTISGNEASRIFDIVAGVEVTIRGVTFADGSAPSGGAIRSEGDTHIENCNFIDNFATVGGGAIEHQVGQLTVVDSDFSGNAANQGAAISSTDMVVLGSRFDSNLGYTGGAIFIIDQAFIHSSTFINNVAHFGGAIYTLRIQQPVATIEQSLFAGNQAFQLGGALQSGGFVTVTNSTFTMNQSGGNAGAIAKYGNADIYTSLTIVENSAGGRGGGVFQWGNASTSVAIGQSIIANNTAGHSAPDVGSIEFVTPFISRGYNIIGQDTDALGWADGENNDQVGSADAPIDPEVEDLADNGGSTQTMSLTDTSPARRAIPEDACLDAEDLPLLVDQRGFARPQAGMCSVGAFEPQVAP